MDPARAATLSGASRSRPGRRCGASEKTQGLDSWPSRLLVVSRGALIASSGTLLSDIMCRGINRSMGNVLLGGFGTDGTSAAAAGRGPGRRRPTATGFVGMLFGAKKVIIVPGYGLAVARCQQKLAEIVATLRKHNVTVHFAIHPVAGRMPGHMNVLLAEADVPYDIVKEMDEINAELPTYDVGIVVGANDIVNPATQDDPSSPIYGMPAIEIWKCKQCVVLKRSMGTGYSGVDNPLFYLNNVKMLFGDAKQSMDSISTCLEERRQRAAAFHADSQDRFTAGGSSAAGSAADAAMNRAEPETFPEAVKVIGVLRERVAGEQRVSFAPSTVPKLRRMAFSILLETGAGASAGFSDEDYTRHGGVQVAESAVEVLKQADVIFKVSANVLNLALVPRVSRAQKLDALTSMANIAGDFTDGWSYRAVLDAFQRFPRFSRAGSTAFGSVPPAKVFVIGALAGRWGLGGAGVAGLSAIATAHSLGCKAPVLANDVRDAAREQVESMGAQFIAVDAQGIAGGAPAMGEDFTRAQLATYARVVPDMDVIITTAMIPNRSAPELITAEMVASMKSGSVIVDLAAPTGGNCVYTEPNRAVLSPNGVLGGASDFGGERWEDPVVKPALVAQGGQIVWDPNPPRHPAGRAGQVTNAISGIIVVGGMLQLSGPVLSARVACALAAVFLSSVNIVGGFAVTARMLEMFREDAKPAAGR
eukprot:Skav208532  [mRNA]  locus=scaffold3037:131753:160941:+ [translate_table: standard]